jgi:S1-C subfamily serine protease
LNGRVKTEIPIKTISLGLILALSLCGSAFSERAATTHFYIVGTGFLVSPEGFVLTNRHVVEECADPIEATYNEKVAEHLQIPPPISRVKILAQGKTLDIAVLATDFRNFPYLRLRAERGKISDGSLPKRDEFVTTLGFIGGEWSVRGGQITDTFDPLLAKLSESAPNLPAPGYGAFGAVVSLGSGHGASGSPIVDDSGLLLGIIWGGIGNEGEPHILNNVAIYAFLKAHGVPVPMANIGPYPPRWHGRGMDAWMKHTAAILGLLMRTTVRITCPAR